MEKPEDPTKDRYNKTYKVGNTEFYLEDYLPNIEECRFILIKIIEQAVRDLVAFKDAEELDLIEIHKEAEDFIFKNDYFILWGNEELNLQMILDILDIDIDWFRDRTRKKLLEKDSKDDDTP